MPKPFYTAVRIGFVLYALLMLWLLFGQRMGADTPGTYLDRLLDSVNLIPFYTIRDFLHTVHSTSEAYLLHHAFINLAGNVVTFVPLGIFLPCIWQKCRTFPRCMLTGAAIIVGIEILQLVTLLGHCDVDDLILNMIGAAIGFGLWKAGEKITSQRRLP